ncbi:hypothetical protein TruAng_003392 [Truncatella angustata]|nr:hypothetical protein TruAng_003392 [Truncatella angustata]
MMNYGRPERLLFQQVPQTGRTAQLGVLASPAGIDPCTRGSATHKVVDVALTKMSEPLSTRPPIMAMAREFKVVAHEGVRCIVIMGMEPDTG